MSATSGVFATLPDSFFSPLASPNREHYAALLAAYYRLFQESPHGVERSALTARFSDYLEQHRDQLAAEEEESGGEEAPADTQTESVRPLAARFLRVLIKCGWVSEETLSDYTRIINMAAYAKPFFEALARVEEGLKTEYESHVVAVYSLLSADAVVENGHYAVLNAHNATVALIDSLKVLSQSIRGHYERLSELADGGELRDLLHLHYDLYASAILDGAYKRLKTSDNLSRYRPRILRTVADLLLDEAWLAGSAAKYAHISRLSLEEARRRLVNLLEEIRDTLKAVDPLLDEIDKRNMLYARASVERVKMLLEPDTSLAGKIAVIIQALLDTGNPVPELSHHLYPARLVGGESRYRRWLREQTDLAWQAPAPVSTADLERAEAELRLRLERQLTPARIAAWLDAAGGSERLLSGADLIHDCDSFVRFLYAVLYADSRPGRFAYRLEEGPNGETCLHSYLIPDVIFRRKQ